MIEAAVAVAGPPKNAILREIRDLASRHAIEGHRLWTDPPLDTQGLPVLLVGGLASTAWQLQVIRDWLVRLNCQVRICPVAYGIGCGERTTERVTESLIAQGAETGRRSVVIAHSRGGQFARAAAVRRPDLVEALIVLGSPINHMVGVHTLLKAPVALLALGGTLGLPGLFSSTCLWGRCCRRLRADLQSPFPQDVSFLSVYSRQDAFVDWQSTLDPAATHREIDASHGGLLCTAEAFEAVADELAQIVDRRPEWGASASNPAPIQMNPAAAA
ncbi:MAG: hypothetical protein QOE58_72 [Actinomycetota bacterium]|jgi:pimeloyl-ACP methyl ester carboxylesterase|nr:hypothetical protein [Actinomycetota bacterium]